MNTTATDTIGLQRRQQPQPDQQQSQTPINQMFNGRSVFITGASGFIGRVLLEKLLRTYQGISRIYILMRTKKNVAPAERLHKHLLKVPIFDQLKSMKNGQQLLDKIVVISGDIGEPNLGIAEQDLEQMLNDESLSVVFHSAATVKFDEPLKVSIKYNVMATKIILDLCKRMRNLVALCHVSTAYVNSDLKNFSLIEEKLYPMQQKPQELLKLAEILDDKLMQLIKSELIDERPNTYTYTKSLAEHLIASEAAELPVAIVRPSIVVASWKEPIPGWIDNLNGPTGLILAIGKGLLRSMHVSRSGKADIIPVDIVVNTMIASAYYAAKTSNKLEQTESRLEESTSIQEEAVAETINDDNNNDEEQQQQEQRRQREQKIVNNSKQQHGESSSSTTASKQPTIFHCTSGETNPITWGNMEDMFFPVIRKYPSEQVLRYPFGSFKSNRYHDLLTRVFVHYLPALIIDLLCLIMGKKRQLLSIYYKLHCATGALSHFSTTNYNFESKNMRLLESCLQGQDKKELYLDIRSLDWLDFWDKYVLGARRFVLKEPDNSLEQARKSFNRAYYVEMCLRTLLVIFLLCCSVPFLVKLATNLPTFARSSPGNTFASSVINNPT